MLQYLLGPYNRDIQMFVLPRGDNCEMAPLGT